MGYVWYRALRQLIIWLMCSNWKFLSYRLKIGGNKQKLFFKNVASLWDGSAIIIKSGNGFDITNPLPSIVYSISGDNIGYFNIDQNNGEITLTADGSANIDHETMQKYNINVIIDNGEGTDVADLEINITWEKSL